jgi:GNAT superfamily N-acetyltransferase
MTFRRDPRSDGSQRTHVHGPATSCTIRRGEVRDAAALAAFAARTFQETFAADNHPDDLRAHLTATYGVPQQSAELSDPDVITLLAETGGELVAYAQIRRKQPPPSVTHAAPVELHRFYVDHRAHGTGLAATLIEAARSAAIELGGRHLWLGVWERNPRAIAFYRKSGFIDVGSTFYMVGTDRQTDRVMVAALSPTSQENCR